MMRAAWMAIAAAAAVVLAGCDVTGFCINCETGAGGGDGGVTADAATGGDGGGIVDASPRPDGCAPAGEEICNGVDDDCDGNVDEAPVAQVGNDCGTDMGECTPGTFECTGGELVCGGGAVNPSPETCNGLDDDCDGTVDDGDPGGGVPCGSDVGECQRGLTECVGGEVVCTGEITPVAELCDTMDNDCDGRIDEGNPEGGAACGDMAGECMPGEVTCIGGTLQCVGGDGPSLERCDGFDNDCDGEIDENFDLDNDPRNCGACGNQCVTPDAQPGCSGGECTIAFCFTDYWDINGEVDDGCEYFCEFSGTEVCNGRDDDCDMETDEALTPPNICNQINECAGTVAECEGMDGWQCNYGPTVSTDADGDIIPETDCDGLDNDCDGVADDFFTTLGDECTRGFGSCQTTGVIACNDSMDGVQCGAPDPGMGSPEACNGVDDDCDNVIDEGAPAEWVQIGGSLWIMQYEASRPDANASTRGTMSHRACSEPDRLPWTNITQPQAEALCVAQGAVLCTEAQWQQACEGAGGGCTWAYDDAICTVYDGDVCNGNDFDFDPGTPGDQDGLLPTESLAQCFGDWGAAGGVFDLSGNVKEWARERSPGVNPLRGGSYNNSAVGISCDFDFTVADDSFQFDNVGFRCCRTSAPP